MSSRFNLSSTSKTLNLSLLRFNERSGFQNLANNLDPTKNPVITKQPIKPQICGQPTINMNTYKAPAGVRPNLSCSSKRKSLLAKDALD